MDLSRLLPLMQGMQQGGGRAEAKPLASFKAGMMHSDAVPGNKLRLAPDNRKGQLAVQHDNEGMVHVKWTDRSTGSVGLDRVVFPHDITFKRIRTGKDTDRVYELKYTANNNRFFFWMQDAKIETDEENVKKFLDSINNPSPAATGTEGGEGGSGNTVQTTGGGMDPQMMSMLQALGIDSNAVNNGWGSERRPGRPSVGPRSGVRPTTSTTGNSNNNSSSSSSSSSGTSTMDPNQLAQVLQQSLGMNTPINLPTVPSTTTGGGTSSGITGSSTGTSSSTAPPTATVTTPSPAPAPTASSSSSSSINTNTTNPSNSTPGNAGQDVSIDELMALDPELAEALRLSMMDSNNNNDKKNNNGGQVVSSSATTSLPSSSSSSSTSVPTTSTNTAAVPPPTTLSYDEIARAMQAITVSGLIPGPTVNRSSTTATGGRRSLGQPIQSITPLPYVLNMDMVESILTGRNSNLSSDEQEKDSLALQSVLLPLLPPDQQTLPDLLQILRSPQLRQAMLSLTSALDTENANIIFSNFNLRAEDGDNEMARGDAVGALVSAMNRDAERNRTMRGHSTGSTSSTTTSETTVNNNGGNDDSNNSANNSGSSSSSSTNDQNRTTEKDNN